MLQLSYAAIPFFSLQMCYYNVSVIVELETLIQSVLNFYSHPVYTVVHA